MYLIGRYFGEHVSLDWVKQKRWYLGIGYLVGSLMLFGLLMLRYFKGISVRYVFQYDHPLVIMNSCCLLLFFLSFSFNSKVVNWIGSSVFAAYLLQESIYFGEQWVYPTMANFFSNLQSYHSTIWLFVVSVVFLLLSVLIDKLLGVLTKAVLLLFDKFTARIEIFKHK